MGVSLRGGVTGDKKLIAKLKRLKAALERRVTRKMVTAGAQVVLEAGRRNVPVETGLGRRSLGKKVVTSRKNGNTVGIVGPRTKFKREVKVPGRKKKQFRNPTRYLQIVELDKPWLRPAFDGSRAQALAAMAAKAKEVLAEEARKS